MNADLQRAATCIHTLTLELVGDRQHVGRCDGDDAGFEVADHPHLALGKSARRGDYGAAEPFRSAVEAEAAGEQAVAVGDVQHVAGPRAGGAQAAGDEVSPHIQVVPGVADDGGNPGGTARRMNTDDLLARTANMPKG